MDELLSELLAKPVGPATPQRKIVPQDFTSQLEVKGDELTAELRRPTGEATDSAAVRYLEEQGLDPAEWEQTGFRKSEWTMANGSLGESARFSFRRIASPSSDDRPDVTELLAAIDAAGIDPTEVYPYQGEYSMIVALGDMQFGKIDGDGVEGTLRRTIECLNRASDLLSTYRLRFNIGHVHLAFLGDHVEGFVSQGGANVWRTPLTLSEQIRLTRRVMLHAVMAFSPQVSRLTVTAVPGNHGQTVRVAGKGVTRYDDSHDTEALISVKDATDLRSEFGHVEYYVPDTDEMTVTVDCSGTVVGHAHGHQWRPGKHWDWWQGQAFNASSPMHQVDLLLAGHLHHERIEADGPRTFIQVPAMESESTWWRHARGSAGAPGLIVAITKDGETNIKEVVR